MYRIFLGTCPGLRGLMLAALLSALMSSLTSTFNSASSIVTLDIWLHIRKRARQTELMVVGRLTVLVLAGVSILWLPILQQSQGGILWFYVQAIKSYLVPPWTMVFILALFWKRTTEQVFLSFCNIQNKTNIFQCQIDCPISIQVASVCFIV